MFKKEYGNNIEFEISEPYYALSENNTGKTIEHLIAAVYDAKKENYN